MSLDTLCYSLSLLTTVYSIILHITIPVMLMNWATNLLLQQGLQDMQNHQVGTLMYRVFILSDYHTLSILIKCIKLQAIKITKRSALNM
jgi:hypothetical protein